MSKLVRQSLDQWSIGAVEVRTELERDVFSGGVSCWGRGGREMWRHGETETMFN